LVLWQRLFLVLVRLVSLLPQQDLGMFLVEVQLQLLVQ
jgi:hypothetical protein